MQLINASTHSRTAMGTKVNFSGRILRSKNDMAVVGFIMAFMMPILGLVFSVIGLKKAKSGAPNRGLALAGVIISSVYLALSVLAALLYMLWFLFVFWMIGSAGSTYASSAVLAIGSIII